MPVKLARLTVFGLVLTMQSAAALDRVHNRRQADSIVHPRHVAARQPVHYDDTPSYNDPSKFGGSTVPSAMAEPLAPPSTEISSPATAVHVQPRGSTFAPNSNEEKAVQKRITDFDEMQRVQEESLDKRLLICRGC